MTIIIDTDSSMNIPTNADDLKEFKKALQEVIDSRFRRKTEAEYERDAIKDIQARFGVKGKHSRQIIKAKIDSDIAEKKAELDEIETAVDSVFSV